MAVPGASDSTSVRGEGDAGSQAAAAVAKAPSVKLTTTSPYHNSKRDVLVKMTEGREPIPDVGANHRREESIFLMWEPITGGKRAYS
eukprot:1195371-Prorocentrum_minimum.AAC.3